jgi:hypothetical protein
MRNVCNSMNDNNNNPWTRTIAWMPVTVRTNKRRNTSSSMGANNSEDKGKILASEISRANNNKKHLQQKSVDKGKSMDASNIGPTTEEAHATAVGVNNSKDKSKTMDYNNSADISKRGILSIARRPAIARRPTMQIILKL